MENTSEYYYEKLKTDERPGNVLASLYCSLYDKDITRSEIILCNRLVKVFGRFTVFFSIMDMVGSYPNGTDNPYPLLYTICNRKFQSAHGDSTIQSRTSLDSYIETMEKEAEKVKKQKIKIPSSEGLAKDG
jgi:hypothetical protein